MGVPCESKSITNKNAMEWKQGNVEIHNDKEIMRLHSLITFEMSAEDIAKFGNVLREEMLSDKSNKREFKRK